MVGAAGDDVAGVQGHHGGGEGDQFAHPVLHVVGVVVVAQLPVVPEPHVQVVGVLDLVGGGDAGADRSEGVERLAEPARRRSGRPGEAAVAAGGDVDHAGVAEHRAAPVPGLHPLGRPLDHQRQLRLVHEHPGLGELRQFDHVAGTHHRVRVFHEHIDRPGLALGVLPIVADAGEDLAGARQRRLQLHRVQGQGRAVGLQPLQRRPQILEPVDDRGHGELRSIAHACGLGDVHHPALGQQPRPHLRNARLFEQDQSHRVKSPPGPRLPAGWFR